MVFRVFLILVVSIVLCPGVPALALGVFGADNRSDFSHSDFASRDLSAVGLLRMVTSLGGQTVTVTCTGFLVTPRLVLTAAHCVWPSEIRKSPEIITFLLRYNGQPIPAHQRFRGEKPLISDAWKQTLNLKHDYAAIPLTRKSFEDGLLVKGLADPGVYKALQQQEPLRIVGYPGTRRGRLFYDVSKEYTIGEGRFLFHRADLEKGQSGGPVFLGRTVVGIHSFMTEQFNASVLLDAGAMKTLRDWMQKYPR